MIAMQVAPTALRLSADAVRLVRERAALRRPRTGERSYESQVLWDGRIDLSACELSEEDLGSERLSADETKAAWTERFSCLADLDPLIREAHELHARLLATYAFLPSPPPRGYVADDGAINAHAERVRGLLAADRWIAAFAASINAALAFTAFRLKLTEPSIKLSVLGTPERKRFDRLHGWLLRQSKTWKRKRKRYDKQRSASRAEHIKVLRADPAYREKERARARELYRLNKGEIA